MPVIEEFPSDDAFRVVKWVDKFTLPHLTTRSPSVTVRLQRLPLHSVSELNRLSRQEAVALLPQNKNDTYQEHYTSVPVHAGLLPHLAIGRVYRGKRLVGELPTTRSLITLPDAEHSCREIRIEDELEKPEHWTYPYRLIFSSEFGGIQTEFGRSRCLAFTNEQGIEYIIPRAVIFRTFYAMHRELANAFTSGPWATTKSKIVYEGELKSGLKTQIHPTSGEWHIILATHIEDAFAKLVSLLYFDEYAKTCAESIYTEMLSDRRGNILLPWFASARLPFRAEAKPLVLDVKGLMLPPRLGRRGPDGNRIKYKQSFLVTSILASSFPSTPDIRRGRFNSGDIGDEQIPADGDRPYTSSPRGRPAGDDLLITSAVDASAMEGDMIVLEDTFSWLDGTEPKKLTKESSQQYGGNKAALPQAPTPPAASGGERTYQGGNAAPAHHKVLVRDPVNRFRYLLDALDSLQHEGILRRHSVFQPANPSQIAQCGGLTCWNFLDELARKTGRWPKTGWRMLVRTRGSGSGLVLGTPRSALVVRVEFGDRIGYWFEIETREAKGGALSPFIVDLKTDEQEAVQHIIECIARADGQNLRQAMTRATKELGSGVSGCYRHHYKGDHNSELDVNSLHRFLLRLPN